MAQAYDGMAEARRRIAEEAERRTGRLDLRDLGLETLPEELFALTHLRELDLGCSEPWKDDAPRNRVQPQCARLGKLAELVALSVAGTDLADLGHLAELRRLGSLDLSGIPCRAALIRR